MTNPAAAARGVRLGGRLEPLDGLRTFAVLAVFVYHGAQGLLPGGFLGVDVFFVLSGMVITLLVLREHERTGGVRLGRFSLDRLTRLWPGLLAVCVVVGVISVVVPGPAGDEIGPAIASSAYLMDFVSAFHLWGLVDKPAFGHTWSLAVEEQFYLVWPLLLLVLLRVWGTRRAVIAIAVLLPLPTALRFVLWDGGTGLDRIYNMPDTRADQLLIGCLLALTLFLLRGRAEAFRRGLRVAIWPSAAVLLLLMVLVQGPTSDPAALLPGAFTLGQLGVAGVAAALIGGLAVNASHPLARVLGSRWLSWPGRHLTYGFYLWHIPVLAILGQTGLRVSLRLVVAFLVTAPIAYLSSRFLEEPIRRALRTRPDRTVSTPVH